MAHCCNGEYQVSTTFCSHSFGCSLSLATSNTFGMYIDSIKDIELLPLQFPIPCYTNRFAGSSKRRSMIVDEDLAVHLLNPLYLVPALL
ncbi:hypothetical protein V6N13_103736 [Hibiscus sabdariffa]|uniref:Uncharacterized protein n=1 Tax=Hibiscus sabdariffa TaxID=183260 RepID=A0ABR2NT17_9ROSI